MCPIWLPKCRKIRWCAFPCYDIDLFYIILAIIAENLKSQVTLTRAWGWVWLWHRMVASQTLQTTGEEKNFSVSSLLTLCRLPLGSAQPSRWTKAWRRQDEKAVQTSDWLLSKWRHHRQGDGRVRRQIRSLGRWPDNRWSENWWHEYCSRRLPPSSQSHHWCSERSKGADGPRTWLAECWWRTEACRPVRGKSS